MRHSTLFRKVWRAAIESNIPGALITPPCILKSDSSHPQCWHFCMEKLQWKDISTWKIIMPCRVWRFFCHHNTSRHKTQDWGTHTYLCNTRNSLQSILTMEKPFFNVSKHWEMETSFSTNWEQIVQQTSQDL